MSDATNTALARLEDLADKRLSLSQIAPDLSRQDWGLKYDMFTQRILPPDEKPAFESYIQHSYAEVLSPTAQLASDPEIRRALPDLRWTGSASEILTDLRRALPPEATPRFDSALHKLKQVSSTHLLEQIKTFATPEYLTHKAHQQADAAEDEARAAARRLRWIGFLALCLAGIALTLGWMVLSGAVPFVTGYTR